MPHRAPDSLTFLSDQVMLENNASWLIFSVFPTNVRSPSASTTRPDPFLLFSALSNNLFMFNQHNQLVFTFGPHPNIFRHITELARSISFSLSVTSSILSLLAKLWNPLVGPISSLVGNPDSRTSPSPIRHCILVVIRV
jgi:hypothetical protein